uniref:Uncharacterized protein n=1 Tax=Eutreptiella gymnastica TaxID=73025 RepID=A0A7S4GD07_9EUGL
MPHFAARVCVLSYPGCVCMCARECVPEEVCVYDCVCCVHVCGCLCACVVFVYCVCDPQAGRVCVCVYVWGRPERIDFCSPGARLSIRVSLLEAPSMLCDLFCAQHAVCASQQQDPAWLRLHAMLSDRLMQIRMTTTSYDNPSSLKKLSHLPLD